MIDWLVSVTGWRRPLIKGLMGLVLLWSFLGVFSVLLWLSAETAFAAFGLLAIATCLGAVSYIAYSIGENW